jgi:hypothetical protein
MRTLGVRGTILEIVLESSPELATGVAHLGKIAGHAESIHIAISIDHSGPSAPALATRPAERLIR